MAVGGPVWPLSIGAGMYDHRSGRDITIGHCCLSAVQTVHSARLVAMQVALQRYAGKKNQRALTDSEASMTAFETAYSSCGS